MLINFIKKNIAYIYVISLLIFFAYVNKITSTTQVEVKPKKEEKKVQESKPAKVILEIYNEDKLMNKYSALLEDTSSFDDFLEFLVQNENLSYEKTMYVYGTEYEQVNNIPYTQDMRWEVFVDDTNVTFNTSGLKLTNGSVYKLVLTPKD